MYLLSEELKIASTGSQIEQEKEPGWYFFSLRKSLGMYINVLVGPDVPYNSFLGITILVQTYSFLPGRLSYL